MGPSVKRLGCGCGQTFATQVGLNEHHRLVHGATPVVPSLKGKRDKRSDPASIAERQRKRLATIANRTPEEQARINEIYRQAQLKRWGKIRAALGGPKPITPEPPPPPPPEPVPTVARLRLNLMEAIEALVREEVSRALVAREPAESVVIPASQFAPRPLVVEKPPIKIPNISMPQPPPAERPVAPSPNGNVIRSTALTPDPGPQEVETVTEPDDPVNAHRNLGMRAAIAIAHRLGIRVRKNSSGELEFSHPFYFRRLRVNHARHTAPRVLLTMLRVVDASIKAGKPVREGPTGGLG